MYSNTKMLIIAILAGEKAGLGMQTFSLDVYIDDACNKAVKIIIDYEEVYIEIHGKQVWVLDESMGLIDQFDLTDFPPMD